MKSEIEARNLIIHFINTCNNSTINSKSEHARKFIEALAGNHYSITQAHSTNTRLIFHINDIVMTVSWDTVFINKVEFALNFTIFKKEENDQFDYPQNILFEFYVLPQSDSYVDIYLEKDDLQLVDSIDYGTEIAELPCSIVYLFTRM